MKRLYENIENIHIKGGVGQLSEIVTAMDVSLQNIAEYTEQLTALLIKYSASNEGEQYEKAVNSSMQLRDILSTASMELNDMQNQIVIYQNKIYRYEEINQTAQKPNPYIVSRNHGINVNTSDVQFNKNEMINVANSLKKYSEMVIYHVKKIIEKKNSIATVWKDRQYNDFAEFIDVITRKIGEALKVFEEYYIHLEKKIKEID